MGKIALLGGAALDALNVRKQGRDLDILGRWDDVLDFIERYELPKAWFPISESKWVAKYHDGQIVEAEIAWRGTTGRELLEFIELDLQSHNYQVGEFWPSNFVCPSRHVMLALKLSHRYLRNSPHFLKTMHDIWALRRVGGEVPDGLKDWLYQREAETLNYGHPKLNVNKHDFFADDGIKYVYDHDSIHQAVKHLERPAYEYFKADGADVLTSKQKFFDCTETCRRYAVLEEAYVLAIERSLVPHPGVLHPRQAFLKALEKVCTSITSGWFREYAWENYFDIDALYSNDYWDRFQTARKFGLVKPYAGKDS